MHRILNYMGKALKKYIKIQISWDLARPKGHMENTVGKYRTKMQDIL